MPDRKDTAAETAPPTATGGLDAEMARAEREAQQYLEHAKRRADSLVDSMVGALEREAEEIRDEAEERIRERWRSVEAAAARHLEEARRVAAAMVGERQERIGALSDAICARAESLSQGMEDADRIQRQFDRFVRALAETADAIAREESSSSRGVRPIEPIQASSPPADRTGPIAA